MAFNIILNDNYCIFIHYRGDNENDHENNRYNGNECEHKHVGPVDPVGPVIRCQYYQH